MKPFKKKGQNDEKGPHPYDFSLKRDTRPMLKALAVKPIPAEEMAKGMARTHGPEKAKNIVEPLTVASFKDDKGVPTTPNYMASYWNKVFTILKSTKKTA